MCELMSEIKTKDAETLKNEILEHTKQQMDTFDIKRLQAMRVKQLDPDSEALQKFFRSEARRRYEIKNRELRNERRKKARLDQKKLLMVPDHIVKI